MKKIQDRGPSGDAVRGCRPARAALLFAGVFGFLSAVPGHTQENLHRAVPPSGRALVFVYRADREPATPRVPVVVNREPVGELANGTFVTATVSPGRTELRIGERLVRTLTFTAAANQSYFVRVQALDARLPVRIDAQSVSEPEGRRSIAQSRHVGIAPVVVIPPLVAPPVAVPPVTPPPVAAPPVVTPPPAAAPVVTPPVVAPAPPVEPTAVAEPPAVKPAPAPVVAAPTQPRESDFALIASAGTFKLSDERQMVAGFPSTFDTTSKSVFSVEGEWRFSSGFALGGEYFTYKNDLVSTATVPNAQQKVHAIMVNGKYYFHAADWLYPFVGVGVGQASASYSGGLTGSATGLAYQGMAGVEIRFKPVGIYLQYKYLSSETGDTGRVVKVGGSGFLGGISISF